MDTTNGSIDTFELTTNPCWEVTETRNERDDAVSEYEGFYERYYSAVKFYIHLQKTSQCM